MGTVSPFQPDWLKCRGSCQDLPVKAGFIGKQFPVIILRLVKSILITSDNRLTEHWSSAVHVSEQTCLFWNVSRLISKMLLISHQLVWKHTTKVWRIAYTAPSGHYSITSLVNWEHNRKQHTWGWYYFLKNKPIFLLYAILVIQQQWYRRTIL